MPLAPVVTPETQHLINNSYIIMLKPGVDTQSMLMHFDFLSSAHAEDPVDAYDGNDGGLRHVYDGPKTKGYAGSFSDRTVERIRAQPEVDYVEQDQIVWASKVTTQRNAPWVSTAPFPAHESRDLCIDHVVISAGTCSGQPSREVAIRHVQQVRLRGTRWTRR